MSRRPVIKDRQTALVLGVAAYVAGSLLLWDAYENRGKARPFVTKLLPGA
jgi:hypothetical protein